MDLEMQIREADPVRKIEAVDVKSDSAQDLYRQIIDGRSEPRGSVTGSCISRVSDLDGTHTTNRRHQVTEQRKWAVAAATILLVVGLASALVMAGKGGMPLRTDPTSSPTASAWRLVSSTAPEIHPFEPTGENPQGIDSLTCPTAQICYLISSTTSTGRLPHAAFSSTDGGTSWLPVRLPSGVDLDTSFSCVSGTDCMVGAEAGVGSARSGSSSVQLLLATTDGGATWTSHKVSIPPIMGSDEPLDKEILGSQGSLYDLHCFSLTSCMAFGMTSADQAAEGSDGKMAIFRTVAMQTGDGGATWSTYVFPWSETPSGAPGWSNAQLATFSCPTEQSCVGLATVLGAPDNSYVPQANGSSDRGDGQVPSALELRTSDGGANWSQSWVSGVQGSAETLACPDQNHCFAIVQTGVNVQPGPTDVLTTSDGGATWKSQQLPSQNPGLDFVSSISCPTITACWISGSEEPPTDPSRSVGAMFATQDGGQTWLPVHLPSGVGSVNQVECVAAGSCLAIGQPPIPNGPTTSSAPIPSFVLTNQGPNQ